MKSKQRLILRERSSRKSTNEPSRISKPRKSYALNLRSARPKKLWILWLKNKKELSNGGISSEKTSKSRKRNIRHGRRSHSQRSLNQQLSNLMYPSLMI